MAFKYTILSLAIISAVIAAPVEKRTKREVIVDQNGFYLGGGSNNNIRESSQIFDLGGPMVNPWINPFTQPHLRIPLLPPMPIPPPVVPAPVVPASVSQVAHSASGYGSYGQQQQYAQAQPQVQQPQYGQQQQYAQPSIPQYQTQVEKNFELNKINPKIIANRLS